MKLSLFLMTSICVWIGSAALAAEPMTEAVVLNEQEQAFVQLMTGAVMHGTFTVDGRGNQPPKPEKYSIKAVRKVEGDNWIVEARITYGELDVPVPVPVQVRWAGDTPMIQVTNLSIPLVGNEFSARVLFDGDRYAGTWQHGNVGGHMFGKVERAAQGPQSDSR